MSGTSGTPSPFLADASVVVVVRHVRKTSWMEQVREDANTMPRMETITLTVAHVWVMA
jgi:hypothetical protein